MRLPQTAIPKPSNNSLGKLLGLKLLDERINSLHISIFKPPLKFFVVLNRDLSYCLSHFCCTDKSYPSVILCKNGTVWFLTVLQRHIKHMKLHKHVNSAPRAHIGNCHPFHPELTHNGLSSLWNKTSYGKGVGISTMKWKNLKGPVCSDVEGFVKLGWKCHYVSKIKNHIKF